MGRNKSPENEKVLYQRIGIRYKTYKRLKEKVEKAKKENDIKFTMSDMIDRWLDSEESKK